MIGPLPNFTAGCLRLLETDWAEGDMFRSPGSVFGDG